MIRRAAARNRRRAGRAMSLLVNIDHLFGYGFCFVEFFGRGYVEITT